MRLSRPGRIWVPEAPHLILNPTREIEIAAPTVRYAGVITAKAVCARTGRVRRETTFKNIITDAALNSLGAGGQSASSLTQFAAVGTGTQEPAAGDVALQNQGATRTNITATGQGTGGNGSNVPPYWNWWRRAVRWAAGGATGTWTEIGFFSASTGGTMFNRQLFRDSNGDPTPFVVLADEELWVDLFVRIYPPSGDVTGSFTITGSGTHDFTMRTCGVLSFSTSWAPILSVNDVSLFGAGGAEHQNLTAETSQPSFTNLNGNGTIVWQSYVNGNFYRDCTLSYNPGTFNYATGIGMLVLPNLRFQVRMDDKILKNSSQRLTINYRQPFGRYTGTL